MKIKNNRSFINTQLYRQKTQVRADVSKSMTTNAVSIGRQTNKQTDQVELSERPEPKAETPKSEVAIEKKPEDKLPSKEELFTEVGAAIQDVLSDEERNQLSRRATSRADEFGSVEIAFAVESSEIAETKLRGLRPQSSLQQIRSEAETHDVLANTLRLYDSANRYLQSDEVEEQLKAVSKANEVKNKIALAQEEMTAENRKTFEEIQRINRETDEYILNLRTETWKKRLELWEKQRKSFIEMLWGPS